MALKSFLFTFDYWQTRAQTESFSTQNEAYKTAVPIQGMFYISRYPAFV